MRWVAASCIAAAGLSAAHGQAPANDKPVAMQSGTWESTMAITSLELTGLPKEPLSAMRTQMSPPITESRCLTRQEAADPLRSMTHQGNCNLVRSLFAGGIINIAGTCLQPGQGKARIVMTGSYTPDTLTAQFRVESRLAPTGTEGPRSFRMSAALHGRRTGRCQGNAATGKEPDSGTG